MIDLGCGPGNSTMVLRDRWPEAGVIGLDSSSIVCLRPFLEVLDRSEAARFKNQLVGRVEGAYRRRVDGRVLFPFRRTFVITCK